MVSAIVCVDNNWGIGSKGNLLVHIPEDMKFFKDKTTNNMVVMGRKTYDSLPLKSLKNRTNVVITSKIDDSFKLGEAGTIFVSMDFAKTVLRAAKNSEIDLYVIGGEQIYKELFPFCSKAYVTKVNHTYENADTFFPDIDDMPEWEVESTSEIKEHNGIEYQFYKYERKRCSQ